MEADGDITTGTSRPGRRPLAVDRKVEFLVHELKRFRMNAVGISETKWWAGCVLGRWLCSGALW